MKILLWIVLALIAIVAAVYLTGLIIPARQTHVRSITVKQTPDAVFALLTDLPNMPKWNRNVVKIEPLPPTDGKETTLQTFHHRMQMTVVTTESVPPSRLVRSVKDTGDEFSGSWTYRITPEPNGSKIVLTEEAETRSALFRALAKLFGQTKYMDEHLADIAKHFGDDPAVQ